MERIIFIERDEPRGRGREDRDSARLARLAGGGDRQAFESLYLRYFDRVYRQLVIALNDSHEAEDTAQEVFVRVHTALSRFDDQIAPFRAWLHGIARNEGLKRLARRDRAGRETLHEPDAILALRELELEGSLQSDPADLFERDQLYIVERLPRDQKDVLGLRIVMDLDQKTVARLLGKSPAAVGMLEMRARKTLEARLRPPAPEGHSERMPMVVRVKPLPVLAGRRGALQPGRNHGAW